MFTNIFLSQAGSHLCRGCHAKAGNRSTSML